MFKTKKSSNIIKYWVTKPEFVLCFIFICMLKSLSWRRFASWRQNVAFTEAAVFNAPLCFLCQAWWRRWSSSLCAPWLSSAASFTSNGEPKGAAAAAWRTSTDTVCARTTGLSCTSTTPSGTAWRSTISKGWGHAACSASVSPGDRAGRWRCCCWVLLQCDWAPWRFTGTLRTLSSLLYKLVAEPSQLLVSLMLVKLSESSCCGFCHCKNV